MGVCQHHTGGSCTTSATRVLRYRTNEGVWNEAYCDTHADYYLRRYSRFVSDVTQLHLAQDTGEWKWAIHTSV